MPSYRLHYFPESGNSYKLALMLTLCGETLRAGVDRLRRRRRRAPAEWRETVNEMGEIPVLEVDGERLTQTAPILLQACRAATAGSAARPRTSSSRCCAGCSGTTTSSPATWRPIATCGPSLPSNDPQVLKHFRSAASTTSSAFSTAHLRQHNAVRDRR